MDFKKWSGISCNTGEQMNSQLRLGEFRRNDKCSENWWCYITGKKKKEKKDCTLERKRWVIIYMFFLGYCQEFCIFYFENEHG